MTDRRAFIRTLAGAPLAAPLAAEAQQAAKVARIGFPVTGSLDSPETRIILDAFRQGLRERGYVEGQNIVIEYRSPDGKIERLPGLATELTRLKVDLIVAGSTPSARAAQQATTTIPIVAGVMGDPVGDGLVASLARPGGTITGLTFLGPELGPTRLELLKEALPKVSRVAALWSPGAFGERATRDMLQQTEGAARALGVQLQLVGVRGPDEFDRAFSTMTKERAEALVAFPSPMLFSERRRIADLAAKESIADMNGIRCGLGRGGAVGGAQLDISVQTRTCPASPGATPRFPRSPRSRWHSCFWMRFRIVFTCIPFPAPPAEMTGSHLHHRRVGNGMRTPRRGPGLQSPGSRTASAGASPPARAQRAILLSTPPQATRPGVSRASSLLLIARTLTHTFV